MDNNGNFEQQFTQNIKSTAMPPAPIANSNPDKLPLVVAIVFGVITLIESIILIVTLGNYFSLVNAESEYAEEGFSLTEEDTAEDYIYDDDLNLIALNVTCASGDGSYYKLDNNNQYEQYTGAGYLDASGSYTITNDSLISLSDSNKVLYFDGFDLADGLTVYSCDGVVTEINDNDPDAE